MGAPLAKTNVPKTPLPLCLLICPSISDLGFVVSCLTPPSWFVCLCPCLVSAYWPLYRRGLVFVYPFVRLGVASQLVQDNLVTRGGGLQQAPSVIKRFGRVRLLVARNFSSRGRVVREPVGCAFPLRPPRKVRGGAQIECRTPK